MPSIKPSTARSRVITIHTSPISDRFFRRTSPKASPLIAADRLRDAPTELKALARPLPQGHFDLAKTPMKL
ncbi:unnamed protein product [Protopolystoma xenopodis]|uniref:Uncharacterized protein n=1 Tax=Protopolystoma xenopodis TaxID=117903 RepID=A0A3S5AVX7_9PLAT|nr:unnamed protein product [Protopolystoma xenopodis]